MQQEFRIFAVCAQID